MRASSFPLTVMLSGDGCSTGTRIPDFWEHTDGVICSPAALLWHGLSGDGKGQAGPGHSQNWDPSFLLSMLQFYACVPHLVVLIMAAIT